MICKINNGDKMEDVVDSVVINFRAPAKLVEKMDELRRKRYYQTRSEFIRQALVEKIDKIENMEV